MSAVPGDGPVDDAWVGTLAAALRAQNDDISLYAGFLFNTLEAALPADLLRVERRRSLRQRFGGEAPPVIAVEVLLPGREFGLRREQVGRPPQAFVRHRVGGVVLRTEELDLYSWVAQLCAALSALAERNEAVRRAVAQLAGPG